MMVLTNTGNHHFFVTNIHSDKTLVQKNIHVIIKTISDRQRRPFMVRKAVHAVNTFFIFVFILNVIATPLDLLFQHKSSLWDLLQSSTTHGGLGLVVIIVTLICLWILLFLIVLFFVWLNSQLSKKDYYQK
jgi:hypothetical protein